MKARPKVRSREERIYTVELEARADGGDDKPLRIIGHPVVYNRWADLGWFREKVAPGSAAKTIAESDIRVLFNHDPNFVLGRNTAGTATFQDQASGLRMEAFPPDTQTIRDLVITPMERGDINQMSFAFTVVNPEPYDPDPSVRYGDHWEAPKKEGDPWLRTIKEFRMYDASIVTFPAYVQTDASVRALVGELDGIGIDWQALMASLTRADRGIPLTSTDHDLLTSSVAVLRSYLPEQDHQEPGPVATTPVETQPAGRSVVHLQRLLDLRARELALI